MSEPSAITKQKILESAKKEFLDKGFMNASLRTIASNAGLTTGAMYRHFKDKDALFCALVDDAIEVATQAVMAADVSNHFNDPDPMGEGHHYEENKILIELLDYVYENFDAFTLLLTKASGSTHEHFFDEIAELYTKNCSKTIQWLYEKNYIKNKLDAMTVHVISTSLISAFTELIMHKIPKEQAAEFLKTISDFFHYGTMHIMGRE